MKTYQIINHRTKNILFEGAYESFAQCLEDAVNQETDLSYARLSYQMLCNANLDGAFLAGADFSHSNLSGANLSESDLRGATLTGVSLYNTCLAYSELQTCNFQGAGFGATDIIGANISRASFSTLSCFDLDFTRVQAMERCSFHDIHSHVSRMSRPPAVIKGLETTPLIFMDNHIRRGHDIISTKTLLSPHSGDALTRLKEAMS